MIRWLSAKINPKREKKIIMKNAARKKSITASQPPENGDVQALIEKRAYEIWESEGGNPGNELDHWLRAEREITGGSTDQPSASSNT